MHPMTTTPQPTHEPPRPKVSVCVVTYNQEKYITQCLQSLVDQETDFPFEVIVSDDCSTDGTPDIVRHFSNRYPDIIKPILHEENIGAYKNFIFVHQQAAGEYIAHVDGDDYALPGKLKRQSKFLDENKECNIVWHRMLIKNEATNIIREDLINYELLPKSGFGRGDIIGLIAIGLNSSKMYRSSVRDFVLPAFPVIDYFANVEQIGGGKAFFVGAEPLGVYRAGIGIASSGLGTKRIMANCFVHFGNKYPEHRRRVGAAVFLLMIAALKNRRWGVAIIYFKPTILLTSLKSMIDVYKFWGISKMLRMPNEVR